MKIKNLAQLKQALISQLTKQHLYANVANNSNTSITIKESNYTSKCIDVNNPKNPQLEPYVQLCISIKHNDILKEITVDVNKNNKNAIISVNDYDDNQFNDLDEFDLMLTIMQTIKQYCTK